MAEFRIKEKMEPVTSVLASTTLADAQQLAHQVTGVFAVVDQEDQPHTLLRDEYLSILTGDQSRTLGELLHRFPALLTVDVELQKLSIKDLTDFSQLLAATKGPGVAVLANNKAIGVLTRGAIARALPLSALTEVGNVRGVRAENLALKGCIYVCRRCPEPHPRRRPRQCDVAPLCPRTLSHGSMELMNE